MTDYERGFADAREQAAEFVGRLAGMMEDGAGELESGGRLRQAERTIRALKPSPIQSESADRVMVPKALLAAARAVVEWDWSGNDQDCVECMERLRILVHAAPALPASQSAAQRLIAALSPEHRDLYMQEIAAVGRTLDEPPTEADDSVRVPRTMLMRAIAHVGISTMIRQELIALLAAASPLNQREKE